jgi:hypothetical protein
MQIETKMGNNLPSEEVNDVFGCRTSARNSETDLATECPLSSWIDKSFRTQCIITGDLHTFKPVGPCLPCSSVPFVFLSLSEHQ